MIVREVNKMAVKISQKEKDLARKQSMTCKRCGNKLINVKLAKVHGKTRFVRLCCGE